MFSEYILIKNNGLSALKQTVQITTTNENVSELIPNRKVFVTILNFGAKKNEKILLNSLYSNIFIDNLIIIYENGIIIEGKPNISSAPLKTPEDVTLVLKNVINF